MSVEVAAKNTCSTVGEGPYWEEKSQTLIYVDIMAGEVHRYNPENGSDSKVKIDSCEGFVGFVVPRKKGGYVVGTKEKLVAFDWENNKINKTEDLCKLDDERLDDIRFNDGKCDSTGRIWAGTMSLEQPGGIFEPNLGSLYSFDTDGKLSKRVSPVTISNGLAWSNDDRVMYYIDSTPRKIYAFDYNKDTGDICNQRVAVDYEKHKDGKNLGLPDGMCIDEEGMLWVACFSGGAVIRFDPNTGKELRRVELPVRRVTSCCFGGKNYEDLYVTCSRYLIPDEEMQAYPLAGSVFKVTGLGVKGFPAPQYCG